MSHSRIDHAGNRWTSADGKYWRMVNDKAVTETKDQRAEMLEVALRMIDNLLDHPMTPIAQKNAQEIIRHALREETSQ